MRGRPEYADNSALIRKLDSTEFRVALTGWISQQCENELQADAVHDDSLSTPDRESDLDQEPEVFARGMASGHISKHPDASTPSQNKPNAATGTAETAGSPGRGDTRRDETAAARTTPRQPLPGSRPDDDSPSEEDAYGWRGRPTSARKNKAVTKFPNTPPMSGQSPIQAKAKTKTTTNKTKKGADWRAGFRAGK
ncbi:hypothetical protein MAA_11737 [Metarhizium robertsii ARSEF 23]|uniref:Uncharacterized protein n=1 Tax=Metarhizium robertsii (strain ARSEF 23 / ATCC MYA-3075) TaxID=655844 RepID=A0A0B2XFJ3_METRA|nr:uncharacterized protein MAA_11737 [Metarhizium robertsii ARSEF 23]KHO10686.1 hypothetical protein MAA_11737 [Metarhizium robertsii ARSEF 23]